MTDLDSTSADFDKEKFIYDKVLDELNRSRDWPIKVMTFSTAIYLALIGLTQIDNISLSPSGIKVIIMFLFMFWILTIWIIRRQHLNYLKYRNIQIRLQKKMGIYKMQNDSVDIFPEEWQKEKPVKVTTGFQGMFFYALYISTVFVISVTLLLCK